MTIRETIAPASSCYCKLLSRVHRNRTKKNPSKGLGFQGPDRTIEDRSTTKQSSESTENMRPDYKETKIEDQSMMKQSSKITANLRLDYEDIKKELTMTKQSSESTAKLPPGYELDDYWMQQVVLKDPKDEEDEFYSAYAHFSTSYPLPEYVVKRAAAAPPYDWYKHQPFRNNVESAQNEKESNLKDQGFVKNKQTWKFAVKKRSNTHSRLFTNKTAASATATPHHIKEEEDQNQLQIDHYQDRSIISLRHGSPANQEPNEELINKLITDVMGCCDVLMLVFQRNLFCSDVDHGQTRLSIPFRQVLNDFLSSEEETLLKNQEQQNRRNFVVKLLIFNIRYLEQQQPCLEENIVYNINFGRWGSDNMYALNGKNWYSLIVEQHKLEINMPVQLWSFREHSQLCFALVKI